MHEAFAAQVLCNVKMLASKAVRAVGARARRGDRRGRHGPLQRARRLDRDRPPVRRDGRAHRDHGAARAPAARRAASGSRRAARPAASARPWCWRRPRDGGPGGGPRSAPKRASSRSRCGATASRSSRSTTSRDAENTITMALQAQLAGDHRADRGGRVDRRGGPHERQAARLRRRASSADLLTSIKFATDGERVATELGHALRKLEGLRKPVVAAVHGRALGGGFELALACHAIVASDDPETLARPARGAARGHVRGQRDAARREPRRAAGRRSTSRRRRARCAPRRRGSSASSTTCAPGRSSSTPRPAHAKALVGHVPRVRGERGDLKTLALEKNPIGRRLLFRKARERERRRRPHTRRPRSWSDVLERFADKGFDAAARLEARLFGELVVSETAHRLIELFFATTALDEAPGSTRRSEARPMPARRGARRRADGRRDRLRERGRRGSPCASRRRTTRRSAARSAE